MPWRRTGMMLTPLAAALAATTIIADPSPHPGWFLCDAVDAPIALLVGRPDRNRRIRITIVPRGTATSVQTTYQLGAGDAGMNQVHYPLRRGGRVVGDLHYVQPGVLADPARARTPTFSSISVDGRQATCRWVADTLFLGLDARRSFLVTREGGGIVYRSFDAARRGAIIRPAGFGATNIATLTIAGGIQDSVAGSTRFRFANHGYTYTVLAPRWRAATVTVSRAGRIVQAEGLLGHMLAAP